MEAAVRSAHQYWRVQGKTSKIVVLSRKLSYHGTTGTTLALSGHWPRRRDIAGLANRPTIPTPYYYREALPISEEEHGLRCAIALDHEIEQLGADNVAAFVVEPIIGASGAAITPPKGYLTKIAEICKKHDVLLIVDEILTGLGRAGLWLAQEIGQVKGDIVCIGKGLNAGYWPISAILINESITAVLSATGVVFNYGHTHSGHPIGAAVAGAVLDILEQEQLVEQVAKAGPGLGESIREIARNHEFVGDVRGHGYFWGLEIVRDPVSKMPYPSSSAIAGKIIAAGLDCGLLLYPARGFTIPNSGDAIIFAPPFNTPKIQMNTMLDRLQVTLNKFSGVLK